MAFPCEFFSPLVALILSLARPPSRRKTDSSFPRQTCKNSGDSHRFRLPRGISEIAARRLNPLYFQKKKSLKKIHPLCMRFFFFFFSAVRLCISKIVRRHSAFYFLPPAHFRGTTLHLFFHLCPRRGLPSRFRHRTESARRWLFTRYG